MMSKEEPTEEERKWKHAREKIRRFERKRDQKRAGISNSKQPKRRNRNRIFTVDADTRYWNCGKMSWKCRNSLPLHFLGEKNRNIGSTMMTPMFSSCFSNGQVTPHFIFRNKCQRCAHAFDMSLSNFRLLKPGETCPDCMHAVPEVLPTFPEPPLLLRELLTACSAEARHFRRNIRHYNSALAMASVRAEFVGRGPGISKYNPTITVHGRMYHEMGALIPPTRKKPRFAAVYIHDTDNAVQHRKHFYGILREDLLSRLATILHENNSLVHTFISLMDLMNANRIPQDVPLVIHAHEKTKPGHERKYNLPESSEVAALIVGELFGAIDIVLRKRGCVNADGFEKMDRIRLGNRMYDPLCCPLLFPSGEDR